MALASARELNQTYATTKSFDAVVERRKRIAESIVILSERREILTMNDIERHLARRNILITGSCIWRAMCVFEQYKLIQRLSTKRFKIMPNFKDDWKNGVY